MHLTMAHLTMIQHQTAVEAFEWLVTSGLLPENFDATRKAEEFVGVSRVRRAQEQIQRQS